MLGPGQNHALQGKEVSDILILSMEAVMMWFWRHQFFQKTFLSTVLVFLVCGRYELLCACLMGDPAPSIFTTRRCHEGLVKPVNMLDT